MLSRAIRKEHNSCPQVGGKGTRAFSLAIEIAIIILEKRFQY